ncbi:Spc98 family-domain-containing protein [Podospora appendiculata]|uniref:Spindle pole body component n=1 Tax=Podospora appendiculata TaxID=314037 RepID=A0AAE0X4K1_9PEZI|nr:Spc98 family-domain-containing protein [Podospora appendiculata]
MAFLAQLSALTDELVDAVASIPENQSQKRQACRESTLRSLRYHNFLRTNEFEVKDRLAGLEERFRVTGREALADAFKKRLGIFQPYHNKWTPDLLHFLLELSDKPAQKSRLADLHLLTKPTEEPPPKLTWQDIAREDGWHQDKALWRTIDYAPSSGDEDDDDAQSEVSAASSTTAPSSPDRHQRTAQDLIVEPLDGNLLLKQAEDSQAWRTATYAADRAGWAKKTPISSLQLLREVLFMLGGLDTTLFDSRCDPVTDYQLVDVSWQTHKALVTSFAECGRKLAPLRSFARRKEHVPLLQVFQDSLQKALRSFDQELAAIQGRFVSLHQDTVVSLVGILPELGPSLAPLYALSSIVRRLEGKRNTHAFQYLEFLFDAVGTAQLEGSQQTYKLLGSVFFDCFQVYLEPIRLWMEEGRLLAGDRAFFVSESSTKLPLHQIWKSQFNLLRTPDGTLHAPRFLQPAIHRIFATGKSIVVLRHLKRHESVISQRNRNEPRMDFATVCPDDLEFAPFSELFSGAFNAWIQSKHHTASATLRGLLFNSYGLSQGLDALQYIYLMSDGSRSDAFASAVFRHLDSFSASWKDRFTLTEIAQEAFAVCVDSFRLLADVDPRGVSHSAVTSRGSVRVSLPAIRLNYRLNWPVRIIVPEEAIQGYRTISTFLLQIRRAMFVLKHPFLSFHLRGVAIADDLACYYLLRTKLLWFCNTMMTYLTAIVLVPNTAKLRQGLRDAADVDDMVAAHSDFISRITHESCHGPKLQPIRECMLDVLDLALKVEDTHQVEMANQAEEEQESSRLSVMSSPYNPTKKGGRRPLRRRKEDEHDDEADLDLEAVIKKSTTALDKPYGFAMRDLHSDLERNLRFIAGGLRGVARASRDEASGKWDLLAEMLEVGIREER